MTEKLTPEYWEERYQDGTTGWDLGAVSLPMKDIIDRLVNQSQKILIPGAGNGFEVSYLWKKGFKNLFMLDWAELPLKQFSKSNPDFPQEQLLQRDFFELEDHFDLILEQTFFCALPPDLRGPYVKKMHHLLNPEGRLQGVLFNAPMQNDRPPYGGEESEYRKLFEPYFDIEFLRTPVRSEPGRVELEFSFIKK